MCVRRTTGEEIQAADRVCWRCMDGLEKAVEVAPVRTVGAVRPPNDEWISFDVGSHVRCIYL